MSEWTDTAARLVAIGLLSMLITWGLGQWGLQDPSPRDITAKCAAHNGAAQIVNRPWPKQRVRVICRDGSVFDAP